MQADTRTLFEYPLGKPLEAITALRVAGEFNPFRIEPIATSFVGTKYVTPRTDHPFPLDDIHLSGHINP